VLLSVVSNVVVLLSCYLHCITSRSFDAGCS